MWTKPILPVIEGHQSYAIGIISNRVDGYPYKLDIPIEELGFINPTGYTVTVSTKIFDSIIQIKETANLVVQIQSVNQCCQQQRLCFVYESELLKKKNN